MAIINREWTERDETELQNAKVLVERLEFKRSLIKKIQIEKLKKEHPELFPDKYEQTKPSKLRSIL